MGSHGSIDTSIGTVDSAIERRALNVSSLLAALAVATLLSSGCGGSSDASADGSSARTAAGSPDIFVDDDFSDTASGWSKDNDDAVLLEYANGGYRILMKGSRSAGCQAQLRIA